VARKSRRLLVLIAVIGTVGDLISAYRAGGDA